MNYSDIHISTDFNTEGTDLVTIIRVTDPDYKEIIFDHLLTHKEIEEALKTL